jgi:hypothetical protein
MHNHIRILIMIPPKKPPTIPPTAPSTTICLVPSLSQYYLNSSQDGTDVIIIIIGNIFISDYLFRIIFYKDIKSLNFVLKLIKKKLAITENVF